MTNEEMLQDLKQFIEATVSQQMAHVTTKDDLANVEQRLEVRIDKVEQRLSVRIDTLDEKLDSIQDAIADSFTHATEVTNESIDGVEKTLEDHEQRLHRLEHRSA